MLIGRGANDMKSAIAAFVAARVAARAGQRHAVAADHRRRGRLCDLRHAADHRLAERAPDPARHDPDRRADFGRPARRHGQDRPPRLGQHVDRRARRRRATSPTRTAPTIRSRRSPASSPRWTRVHLDDGTDAVPAVEPRIHRRSRRRPTPATSFPARRPRSSTSASTISTEAPIWCGWSRRSPSARRPARRSARGFRARRS